MGIFQDNFTTNVLFEETPRKLYNFLYLPHSLFVVLLLVFVNITSVGGTKSRFCNFDSALIKANILSQI